MADQLPACTLSISSPDCNREQNKEHTPCLIFRTVSLCCRLFRYTFACNDSPHVNFCCSRLFGVNKFCMKGSKAQRSQLINAPGRPRTRCSLFGSEVVGRAATQMCSQLLQRQQVTRERRFPESPHHKTACLRITLRSVIPVPSHQMLVRSAQ